MKRILITIFALVSTKLVFAVNPICIDARWNGAFINAYVYNGLPVLDIATRDTIIVDHNTNYNPAFSTNSVVTPISNSDFTSCTLTADEVALATSTYGTPIALSVLYSSAAVKTLSFAILAGAGYLDPVGVNGSQIRSLLTDKTTLRRAAYEVWTRFNALQNTGLADPETLADTQALKSYLVFMKRVFLTL